MLLAQPLVHQILLANLESPNANYQRYHNNIGYLNKLKTKIPKYDGLNDQKVVIWVTEI